MEVNEKQGISFLEDIVQFHGGGYYSENIFGVYVFVCSFFSWHRQLYLPSVVFVLYCICLVQLRIQVIFLLNPQQCQSKALLKVPQREWWSKDVRCWWMVHGKADQCRHCLGRSLIPFIRAPVPHSIFINIYYYFIFYLLFYCYSYFIRVITMTISLIMNWRGGWQEILLSLRLTWNSLNPNPDFLNRVQKWWKHVFTCFYVFFVTPHGYLRGVPLR